MKINNFIVWLLIWILISISWIIWFNYVNPHLQKVYDINTNNLINQKLAELRNSIKDLNTNSNNNYQDKFNKFWEIKKILDTQYYSPDMISGSKMWENALQAFVSSLWDPFTVYLTSIDNKSLHDELKWSSDFQGIWAVVSKNPEWIILEQIFKDSPAQKAGLKPLDIVIKANWTWLANLPLGKAVSLIKGPKWTKVKLTIKRENKIFDIEVTRWKIELKSVMSKDIKYKWKRFKYISISSVWEKTYNQLEEIVKNLDKNNFKWVILDLRWNWGGYLSIWYEIWSLWAKKWDIVVWTKYRDTTNNKDFKAITTWKLHWFPTVILTDGYTASAWEIITAAIKENNEKTTKLVWTKTFWKWTIQTLYWFPDWSSLKYTIWKWFTPKWENVCKKWVLPWKWIKPDIEVKFDTNLYKKNLTDNQLEKAKEVIYWLSK